MAQIIKTTETYDKLSDLDTLQVYNGLDCCITREVFDALHPQLDKDTSVIYQFERALQGPALDIMLRGVRIDKIRRALVLSDILAKADQLQYVLNRLGEAIWGAGINPNSPKQLQKLFYRYLGIPTITNYTKGEHSISVNRAALETIQTYPRARILAKTILQARELLKKASVLRTKIDADGRIRTQFKVCGTETGRWSSAESAFGTGTNLQNITPELRDIFVADSRKKLAYIDLEQAESRMVGLLVWEATNDGTYLDACESEDLHVAVSKMIWPELAWTGDPSQDRKVSEVKFYRDFSYRDMAKRAGHATNYTGQPRTVALALKTEIRIIEDFQYRYFNVFPAIRRWHHDVARLVQLTGSITTALRRKRRFWGRLHDNTTIKEAVAYGPQSAVADILNLGLWKIWHNHQDVVDLLLQEHDAILLQYPQELETQLLPKLCQEMLIPLTLRGRTVTIPVAAETGWNWGKASPTNPDGLVKWKGYDARVRRDNP